VVVKAEIRGHRLARDLQERKLQPAALGQDAGDGAEIGLHLLRHERVLVRPAIAVKHDERVDGRAQVRAVLDEADHGIRSFPLDAAQLAPDFVPLLLVQGGQVGFPGILGPGIFVILRPRQGDDRADIFTGHLDHETGCLSQFGQERVAE